MTTYCGCLSHLLSRTEHRVYEVRECPSKGSRRNSYLWFILTPSFVVWCVIFFITLQDPLRQVIDLLFLRPFHCVMNVSSILAMAVDVRYVPPLPREYRSWVSLFSTVPWVIQKFAQKNVLEYEHYDTSRFGLSTNSFIEKEKLAMRAVIHTSSSAHSAVAKSNLTIANAFRFLS